MRDSETNMKEGGIEKEGRLVEKATTLKIVTLKATQTPHHRRPHQWLADKAKETW